MTSCITCNKHCNDTVDFIVVGMGAGGATVLRLLYDAGFTVAGIEAGGNHDKDELIIDSTNAGVLEEEYTWKYFFEQTTEPNEDMGGKVLNYTTGRMIGGGTSINGMQYVRGSDKFWDDWAAINGTVWSASQIALDFKALEKFVGVAGQFIPAVHGVDGKMQIRQAPTVVSDLATDFATALAGISSQPLITDYNNPTTPVGTFTRWSLFQQPNGDRASSSIDFLTDVVDENGNGRAGTNGRIRIYQNSTVNKVLFNDQNCLQRNSCSNVARGVEYIQFGQTKQLYARKEVVLSAGIHSNEILQRSGVGPKMLLESLGISVIFDNANVGAGSRNHLITTAFFNAPIAKSNITDPNALYTGGAFLPTPVNTPNPVSTVRGFQWIGIDTSSGGNGGLFVVFYNLTPQSLGTDRLQDRDPFRVTDVAENLLSEPQDLIDIKNVYIQQVTALNTALGLIDPGYSLATPSPATIADDGLLTEYILDNIEHTHHWAGTCKMAPLDQGGVVNAFGEVFGTRHLRVADISTAATIPDGNTAGPAFLVGYKIAQFIIKKYKNCVIPKCACASSCKCGCQKGKPCKCNTNV